MKFLNERSFRSLLGLALMGMVLALSLPFLSGCSTTPNAQHTEYTTLRVIGASRDAAMQIAAHEYNLHHISPEQWAKIKNLHDNKLQPAYRFAVAAAMANLDTLASPDLVDLANQLAQLIAQFTGIPPPVPLRIQT